mmetsp:Transcript_13039/g.36739  ORF Transcript_13039/g.36739 Transcript_13039/m.36739 type:complete len:413 (-) Transcript_13039:56-1294(-)
MRSSLTARWISRTLSRRSTLPARALAAASAFSRPRTSRTLSRTASSPWRTRSPRSASFSWRPSPLARTSRRSKRAAKPSWTSPPRRSRSLTSRPRPRPVFLWRTLSAPPPRPPPASRSPTSAFTSWLRNACRRSCSSSTRCGARACSTASCASSRSASSRRTPSTRSTSSANSRASRSCAKRPPSAVASPKTRTRLWPRTLARLARRPSTSTCRTRTLCSRRPGRAWAQWRPVTSRTSSATTSRPRGTRRTRSSAACAAACACSLASRYSTTSSTSRSTCTTGPSCAPSSPRAGCVSTMPPPQAITASRGWACSCARRQASSAARKPSQPRCATSSPHDRPSAASSASSMSTNVAPRAAAPRRPSVLLPAPRMPTTTVAAISAGLPRELSLCLVSRPARLARLAGRYAARPP